MRRMIFAVAASVAFGWCAPAQADCLVKPLKSAHGTTSNFPVMAPSTEVAEYQAKGFVPVRCEDTRAAAKAVNAKLCDLAAIKNQAMQKRIEEVLGMPAARLCVSTNLAEGKSEQLNGGDPEDNLTN